METLETKDHYLINNNHYKPQELIQALVEGYQLAKQVRAREADVTREIADLKVQLDNKKAERKRLQSMRKLKLLLTGARRDRLLQLLENELDYTEAAKILGVETSKLRQDLLVLSNYIQWKRKYDLWT